MSFHSVLQSLGIDPSLIYAGAAGGALRALSRRKLKIREVILSPLCGVLASAYLTIPVVQYVQLIGWPFPEDASSAILASAFLIGTCAMWIADLVFGFIAKRFGLSQHQPPAT